VLGLALRFPISGGPSSRSGDALSTRNHDRSRSRREQGCQYRAPSLHPVRQTLEITVQPDRDLTDELVPVIAISAPWLNSYLQGEGG